MVARGQCLKEGEWGGSYSIHFMAYTRSAYRIKEAFLEGLPVSANPAGDWVRVYLGGKVGGGGAGGN